MKKSLVPKFLDHEIHRANKLLHQYSRKHDPEALHHLRISLKKIKATCAFAFPHAANKKRALPLQALYRESGRIRNLHVYLHMLSAVRRRPVRLISRLQAEEAELSRRFVKRLSLHEKSLRRFAKQVTRHAVPITQKRVRKYFQKKKKKILALLEQPGRNNMHRCRTQVKKTLYVNTLLHGKAVNKSKVDLEWMDDLQQDAGKWHDTYSFLLFAGRRQLSGRQFPEQLLKKREQAQFRKMIRTAGSKARRKDTN